MNDLLDEVRARRQDVLNDMALALQGADYPRAVGQVRALMFIDRFADDVGHQLDKLLG
jgi:hypothetical protein